MNLKQFSEAWVNKHGLKDKDSDYNGMLGEAVLELVELFSKQGHSGYSAKQTISLFTQLFKDYDDGTSEIWVEYWNSKEGQKQLKEHNLTVEDIMKVSEDNNATE